MPRSPKSPDMPTIKAHIEFWRKEVRLSILSSLVSRTEKRCSLAMFWRYWAEAESSGMRGRPCARTIMFREAQKRSHREHESKAVMRRLVKTLLPRMVCMRVIFVLVTWIEVAMETSYDRAYAGG